MGKNVKLLWVKRVELVWIKNVKLIWVKIRFYEENWFGL